MQVGLSHAASPYYTWPTMTAQWTECISGGDILGGGVVWTAGLSIRTLTPQRSLQGAADAA